MINASTEPMLVAPEISPNELDTAIRKAISYTIKNEAEYFGSTDGTYVFRVYRHLPTFAFYFGEELKGQHHYPKEFIQAAFDLCKVAYAYKSKEPFPMKALLLAKPDTIISGKNIMLLRSGLKTVLFHLWHQRTITLPLCFYSEKSIKKTAYNELLTEVAALFWNYDCPKVPTPQNHPVLGSWDDCRFYLAHRIVWATDWHFFEDVGLQEMSELHNAVLNAQGTSKFPNARWPFVPMLLELLNQHGDRVKFTLDDVRLYERWTYGRNRKKYLFSEFRSNIPAIEAERKKRYRQLSTEGSRRRKILKRERLEELTGVDLSRPRLETFLEQVAAKNNHDAAIEYFTEVYGLKRGYASTTPYPGREQVDVASLSSFWHKTFEGWLRYREGQEYEDNSSARGTLRVLCDYLFLYLPWWAELYPRNGLKIPTSPVDFDRFRFLVPTGKNIEESPLSFFEISKLRRKTINAQAPLISELCFYFDYLLGHQNLYPELEGAVFTNPVVLKLDFPKNRIRNYKTNKVPFPRKVFPYLLRYFYAIEEFGIHLQQLVLQGQITFQLHNKPDTFAPEDYGYFLQFEFGGRTHNIDEIPNAFSIVKRTIRNSNDDLLCVYIPHLTALRVLIVGLETGLRIQTIQWLDRRTFDSLNANKPLDNYIFDLFVNTDKTKDMPWVAPIVYRARGTLLREKQFQESIAEEGMEDLVPYENRSNSRFADVLPLFRTGGYKGMPINDTWYYKTWLKLIIGFQKFYNEQISIDIFTPFVEIKPSWDKGIEADGNERIEYDENGIAYCPLRYAPIHTPHSVRSTFISNRSGILDIEDTARAVGHLDKLVTYHYTVESYEQLVTKVEAADRELWNYDPDNPVHIRADHENSALRRSFEKDPAATEKRFGFRSLSLLNEKEEGLKDGVELLRTTPMSQVVFRETHICPVGEACPDDVMDLIQEPRRCGLCPLAVKSVDHLPAIAAKMSQLLEQVQGAGVMLKKMEERGEPQAVFNEINERRKLDVYEYIGWKRALQTLSETLEKMKDDVSTVYYVDEPEVVKRHLRLVCKQTNKVEFILARIADADAYPSMETPELRANANRLRQQLLANLGRVEDALKEVPAGDEVTAFLSSMRAVMKALGLSRQSLLDSKLLENNSEMLPAAQPPKLLPSSRILNATEPEIHPKEERV